MSIEEFLVATAGKHFELSPTEAGFFFREGYVCLGFLVWLSADSKTNNLVMVIFTLMSRRSPLFSM